MNPMFRITVGSDPDHEELVGEVYFDDAIVCILTQESGFEAMEIEFFPPNARDRWVFRLADLEEALNAVKKRLSDLQRVPPPRTP